MSEVLTIPDVKTVIVSYLENFQQYYPGILEWYSRIQPEIEAGRRTIFLASNNGKLQGLVITKNVEKAKLCHISVSSSARKFGIGKALMRLAISNVKRFGAKEIRVTTSEEVFRNHRMFFHNAGFKEIDWKVHRYRQGISEIIWKMDLKANLNMSKKIETTISKAIQTKLSCLSNSLNEIIDLV